MEWLFVGTTHPHTLTGLFRCKEGPTLPPGPFTVLGLTDVLQKAGFSRVKGRVPVDFPNLTPVLNGDYERATHTEHVFTWNSINKAHGSPVIINSHSFLASDELSRLFPKSNSSVRFRVMLIVSIQ